MSDNIKYSEKEKHEAWKQMEKLLDANMPVKPKRRKILPLLLILGLATISITYYILNVNKTNTNIVIEGAEITATSKNLNKNEAVATTIDKTVESKELNNTLSDWAPKKVEHSKTDNLSENKINRNTYQLKSKTKNEYFASSTLGKKKLNTSNLKNEFVFSTQEKLNKGRQIKQELGSKNILSLDNEHTSIRYEKTIIEDFELLSNTSFNLVNEEHKRSFDLSNPILMNKRKNQYFAEFRIGTSPTLTNFSIGTNAGLVRSISKGFRVVSSIGYNYFTDLMPIGNSNTPNLSDESANGSAIVDSQTEFIWKEIHELRWKIGLQYVINDKWNVEYATHLNYILNVKGTYVEYTLVPDIFEDSMYNKSENKNYNLENDLINNFHLGHQIGINYSISKSLSLGFQANHFLTNVFKESYLVNTGNDRTYFVNANIRYLF